MLSFCEVIGTAIGVAVVGFVMVFMGMCAYLTIGGAYYRRFISGMDSREVANELFNEAETGFKLFRMGR